MGPRRYAAPTKLRGRHAEQAQIEQLLEAARLAPAGLALEGAPGIGKTSLLRSAVARAGDHGFRALACSPAEPDAALAFAGLGDLFDGLPDDALEALPEPQRRALAAALFVGDAARAPSDPQALPRAVLSLLRGLAVQQPLLLVLDDEQWLDRPSARVLAFALCRLRSERVCVLIARRPQSDGALWPELARGFGDAGLPALGLAALDLAAVHGLLLEQFGRSVPPPLLRRIYHASGGNPLYALAIGREIQARGAVGESELPLPATLADAIARRLDGLAPRAAEPLLVAAAMSNPTLAALQAVLPGFTLTDLASAERAEVVEITGERVGFTHPLLASTHYRRAPPAQRRELHRRLAEVVSDEVERATHLARGAEAPDWRLAVVVEQAAGEAAQRGAPETAAELLEHARRLTPADRAELRDIRTVTAAEQHYAAGDLGRARALLEGLLEHLCAGGLRARALIGLARTRMDDFEAAGVLLREAISQAAEHPRVSAQAQLLLAELWVNGVDPAVALDHARAAVTLAERSQDPDLLARTLAELGSVGFFKGDGVQRELMERALPLQERAEMTSSYYVPSTSLGCQLFWSDQIDEARPLLERSLRRAAERGEESDRAGVLFHLTHLEWEAGNSRVAEHYTQEVGALYRQLADEQGEAYRLWLEAYVAARHGRLGDARARADEGIELAARIGDRFIVCFCGLILAAIEVWTGHPAAAHARVPGIRDELVGGGHGFVGALTIPSWSCDIEALVALGRLPEAEEVLQEFTARARAADNPNAVAVAQRCEGLIRAAAGDAAAAIEAMEQALANHALRPLPMEVGRTRLECGSIERRARRKAAAKRSLDAAVAILEPLEAAHWLARARDELGRIGLRRAAPSDGLTAAQARVAELVVQGRTNREIAETLYMSQRTVETHLTSVYRHFGVRTRTELAAKASSTELHPGHGEEQSEAPTVA